MPFILANSLNNFNQLRLFSSHTINYNKNVTHIGLMISDILPFLALLEMRKKSNNKVSVELKKNAEKAILEAFGKNLKKIRDSKNLSQEEVAFTSGLSRSYYSEVELGKRNVSLINITKIALALETNFSDFFSSPSEKKNFKP